MGLLQNHTFEHCGSTAYKKKILVIDDDDIVRDVVLNMLMAIGFEAIGAEDALEGLHIFLSHDCNIIITDMDMPGMDGLHFAFHIKGISPSTPIALMTGQARAEILEKATGSYFDGILLKPFGLEELRETIQRLMIDNGCFESGLNDHESGLQTHEKILTA